MTCKSQVQCPTSSTTASLHHMITIYKFIVYVYTSVIFVFYVYKNLRTLKSCLQADIWSKDRFSMVDFEWWHKELSDSLSLSSVESDVFVSWMTVYIVGIAWHVMCLLLLMRLGAVSQSGPSPVPWFCLVSSSWQQAACIPSSDSLCNSETVQCRVVPCHSYHSAMLSFVNCRTCWHHWEMDWYCPGSSYVLIYFSDVIS